MSDDFQIVARNANAPFTLKLHRGDGMTLLAMHWKAAKPPRDFAGFALEYKEPDSGGHDGKGSDMSYKGPGMSDKDSGMSGKESGMSGWVGMATGPAAS